MTIGLLLKSISKKIEMKGEDNSGYRMGSDKKVVSNGRGVRGVIES